MEVAKSSPKKLIVWGIGAALIVEFIIFKYYYPHAAFIDHDSYYYLQAANFNLDIEFHPIGYSRFLRLFSVFSHSDTALITFQYFAIQSSLLWFLNTLFNYFPSSKLTKFLILVFFVFNPVLLFLSNYVSSDALFLTLSLVWFTLLIKIIYSPSLSLALWQALFLFLTFIVRYNALYYPFLSVLAFLLCPLQVKRKIVGIAVSFLPIIIFIWYSSNQYYELTGTRQFAAFGGWQLANNALYAYRYIDNTHLKIPPPKFQDLDHAVRVYFDTTRDLQRHPEGEIIAGTQYMWDERSPLNAFMRQKTIKDSSAPLFKKWSFVAPLYSEYGSWLIHQYPNAYITQYLLPNAIRIYVPPLEFLEQYNGRLRTVAPIAQYWFKYKSNKVMPVLGDFDVKILNFMPFTVAIFNVAYLLGCIGYAMSHNVRMMTASQKVLLLTIMLWITNFGFSVIASPITLRYQLFAFQIFGSFAFLLFDTIIISSLQ